MAQCGNTLIFVLFVLGGVQHGGEISAWTFLGFRYFGRQLGIFLRLTEKEILTPLPLWRHIWHLRFVFIFPAVIFLFTVSDLKIGLSKLSLLMAGVCCKRQRRPIGFQIQLSKATLLNFNMELTSHNRVMTYVADFKWKHQPDTTRATLVIAFLYTDNAYVTQL